MIVYRGMYFAITTTYYQHPPSSMPIQNIERQMEHELELFKNDVETIERVVQNICCGFFKETSWPLSIGKNINNNKNRFSTIFSLLFFLYYFIKYKLFCNILILHEHMFNHN